MNQEHVNLRAQTALNLDVVQLSAPEEAGRTTTVLVVVFAVLPPQVAITGEGSGLDVAVDTYSGTDVIESAEVRDALRRNGFAVTDTTSNQMFDFYLGSEPYFITTDSAFHCFHVLYEDLVLEIERENARTIPEFCRGLLDLVTSMGADDADAATRECLYIFAAVPARLYGIQGDEANSPRDMKRAEETIAAELDLIRPANDASAVSPYTGRPHDYTRYRARSFYVGDPGLAAYFRATVWFQLHGLRSGDDADLRCALALSRIMEDRRLRSLYERISGPFTDFLGPPDDLRHERLRVVRRDPVGHPAGTSGPSNVPTYRAEELERAHMPFTPDLQAFTFEHLHVDGIGVRQDHHEPRAARPAISG